VFAAVGALSHEHGRAFSASLIYLGLGVVAAAAIAVLGIGWVDPVQDSTLLEHITELAVVIALFSTGLKVERALRWRQWSTVTRLLAIGMPAFIVLAAAFGSVVMGLSLGAAVALAGALAPTDPVLAGDVGVGPPGQDEEHEPHFGISAEAGFNDGLAFPFVLLGLAIAEGSSAVEWVTADLLYAVVGGGLLGVVMGWGIAASIVRLRDSELLIPALDGWLAVAATLAVYGIAETLATYGFLAVFAAGLAFRRYERDHEINARVHHGASIVEKFGELAVILLLGSMLSLDGLGAPGLAGWGLALLVVLVLRPLTVNLALLGSRLQRPGERAFLAWFGVRGVGTLFYAAVAVAAGSPLPEDERQMVAWTAIACVVLSVVLHGITGGPLSRWLGRNVLSR
jgi:NhaP-type Na+/H+ or K+/H+ antiporter